jgi:hypothetical protein
MLEKIRRGKIISLFRTRNLFIGVATFIASLVIVGVIWGFSTMQKTVIGQVTSYLLSPNGEVEGLMLSTGDQVRFGPQTGVAVVSQIKIGDQVSVTGHIGSKSVYGREMYATQLSANGQTITVTSS